MSKVVDTCGSAPASGLRFLFLLFVLAVSLLVAVLPHGDDVECSLKYSVDNQMVIMCFISSLPRP